MFERTWISTAPILRPSQVLGKGGFTYSWPFSTHENSLQNSLKALWVERFLFVNLARNFPGMVQQSIYLLLLLNSKQLSLVDP